MCRLILNFRYEDVRDNYVLLVPHFFLLMKIFRLILAPTLQIVPHLSSFFLCQYWQGKNFTFLKQRGFGAFPITNIGILSPATFAAAVSVMQTLLNFPPEHFSDLSWHVLSYICRIVQTHQRWTELDNKVGSEVSFQTFFFCLGFLSRTFTIHRTAGEGRGHYFKSSLPLPPASQALRH